MSGRKLKEVVSAGEVSESELKADLIATKEYFTRPAKVSEAVECYRMLCATHNLRDAQTAERSYVYQAFARDCVDEGLSVGQIEFACAEWRRGSVPFAPTFGQLLAVLKAGRATAKLHKYPSEAAYAAYAARVRMACDVPQTAPVSFDQMSIKDLILKIDNGSRALASAVKLNLGIAGERKSALLSMLSEFDGRASEDEKRDNAEFIDRANWSLENYGRRV